MKKGINHEAFIAEAHQHLEAIKDLVALYGYEDFVFASFRAKDNFIQISSMAAGLSYYEYDTERGKHIDIGKEVA